MNRSSEPVDATLTIEIGALGRSAGEKAAALLGQLPITSTHDAERLTLRFRLGPEQANVLEVR
jgi:hypothetical protein